MFMILAFPFAYCFFPEKISQWFFLSLCLRVSCMTHSNHLFSKTKLLISIFYILFQVCVPICFCKPNFLKMYHQMEEIISRNYQQQKIARTIPRYLLTYTRHQHYYHYEFIFHFFATRGRAQTTWTARGEGGVKNFGKKSTSQV